MNHDTENTILGLDVLINASVAALPVQSSAGSSSLSELGEDESLDTTAQSGVDTRLEEDNDSGAKTQRLADLPYKPREMPFMHRRQAGFTDRALPISYCGG